MPLPSMEELLNRDMTSLLADKIPQSTDISKISIGSAVSSDKLIESVSKSNVASNVFGVFDTKQVVQELSGDLSSTFSTEFIDNLDPWKLANLAMKYGESILTDLDFESALNFILEKLALFKQFSFSSKDLFGNLLKTVAGGDLSSYLDFSNGINLDVVLASFLPGNMTASDFKLLQGYFNGVNGSQGLNTFNSCDDLSSLLGWSKNLIDPNSMQASLSGLFNLLGKYDISGVLDCLDGATNSLSIQQYSSLSRTLIENGAIGSYYDLTKTGANPTLINKYLTAREIGSSRLPVMDPFTLKQGRIFETPGPTVYTASMFFENLMIQKNLIFSENAVNDTLNDSILSKVEDPIYDRESIVNAPTENKFTSFCFDYDGTDDLIRSVPDALFV